MEEQKGACGEQGFLPVPLFISASCFSSAAAMAARTSPVSPRGLIGLSPNQVFLFIGVRMRF